MISIVAVGTTVGCRLRRLLALKLLAVVAMAEDGNVVVWTIAFGKLDWGIATGCKTVCCALLPMRRSYDACRFNLDPVAWAANLDVPCCSAPLQAPGSNSEVSRRRKNAIGNAVWRMQFGSFDADDANAVASSIHHVDKVDGGVCATKCRPGDETGSSLWETYRGRRKR